jgi:hypothetical protein
MGVLFGVGFGANKLVVVKKTEDNILSVNLLATIF